MIYWLALVIATPARAAPLVAIDSVLGQPIAQRLSLLERRDRRSFERELIAAAFDPTRSLRQRWRAVTTMGKLDARAFRAALDRAGRAPEWFMRNAALIARINDERETAVAAAVRALDDPALMVRTQAVRNLIHFNAVESGGRLWRALGHARNFSPGGESLWIRAHVAEALAAFARPGDDAAQFRRLLDDRDPRLHRWGVRACARAYGREPADASLGTEALRRVWLGRIDAGAI